MCGNNLMWNLGQYIPSKPKNPKCNNHWPKTNIFRIIVVSLAQLSGVKLPSAAFDTQLPWFDGTLLAPTVRHL